MSGRVLVTGGAGFIGSHIAEAYLRDGWEVVVLDDLSRGHESNVPKGARFVRADIVSPEARETVAAGRFDVLNHHAAQIDVRVSVDRPAFDSHINVVGFVNLLEGAGEGGVKRVIFASSGGVVYGDPDCDSRLRKPPPSSRSLPMALASSRVSTICGRWRPCEGFDGVAMRYANVFGPRQDPKSEAGVVSIFVSRLLAGQPLTVFGDGRQTRDYVFVKDVARANVLAASVPISRDGDFDGPAFNIATSVQRNVLELRYVRGTGHESEARARIRPAACRVSSSAVLSMCRRPRRYWAGLPSTFSRTDCGSWWTGSKGRRGDPASWWRDSAVLARAGPLGQSRKPRSSL